MRGRFPSYNDYAKVTFEESFLPSELADAYVVKSECFESSYIENKGNGHFVRKALPVEAQVAPVFGLLAGDYNNDGTIDVLLAGNNYATEASTGRYDALTGLLLAGSGHGTFAPVKSAVSGFKADGDVKSIAELNGPNNAGLILVGNNSGMLQAFKTANRKRITLRNADAFAILQTKNGSKYRQEFYYGNNYLSQSARTLYVGKDIVHATIFDNQNTKRELVLQQP